MYEAILRGILLALLALAAYGITLWIHHHT